MKVTWVLLLALGVVSAEVGLGYHYKVPETSYGVPSYQFGGNSGQYSSAYAGSLGLYNTGSLGLHNTGSLGLHNTGSLGLENSGSLGLQNSGSLGLQNTGSLGLQNTGFESSTIGPGFYESNGFNSGFNIVQPSFLQTGFQSQYESSSLNQAALKKYQNYYQVQQQPTQVFKHFYVHAAPEEPEEAKPRAPIVLPAPQKHYKIIFVKAPSVSSKPSIVAPIQPQNEEKTIVYVLVKKPDEQPEVVLPKIEQKPPSKPEVYFIKYKNKEDSQAVINNIVQDYNNGGHSVSVNSGSSEGSASFSSGLGSVQYQAPLQTDFSSDSFGQSFGLSSASTSSGSGLESSSIVSSIAPVTVSSTASSISYDGDAISTSQGVPHETYGPPKFREI